MGWVEHLVRCCMLAIAWVVDCSMIHEVVLYKWRKLLRVGFADADGSLNIVF